MSHWTRGNELSRLVDQDPPRSIPMTEFHLPIDLVAKLAATTHLHSQILRWKLSRTLGTKCLLSDGLPGVNLSPPPELRPHEKGVETWVLFLIYGGHHAQ